MRRLQRCCALMCLCDQPLISGLWPHAGGFWSTARHGLRLHCRHNLLLGAPSLTSFGNEGLECCATQLGGLTSLHGLVNYIELFWCQQNLSHSR